VIGFLIIIMIFTAIGAANGVITYLTANAIFQQILGAIEVGFCTLIFSLIVGVMVLQEAIQNQGRSQLRKKDKDQLFEWIAKYLKEDDFMPPETISDADLLDTINDFGYDFRTLKQAHKTLI
jgi:hypothetical protein